MWKVGGWGLRLYRKQPPLDDETGALFVYMLGSGGEVLVALEETHKPTRSSLPGLTCGWCWKVNGHLWSMCSVVTASQTCKSHIWLLRSEDLLSQWYLLGFVCRLCPKINFSLFVKLEWFDWCIFSMFGSRAGASILEILRSQVLPNHILTRICMFYLLNKLFSYTLWANI